MVNPTLLVLHPAHTSTAHDVLTRDKKQVYDTSVTENLEIGSNGMNHEWLDAFLSEPSPEAKAKGDEAAGSYLGTAPVN
jgi:hypothetical protein